MSTQLLKTPLGQVKEVKHLLMNEGARNQLAMVAAKHMNPERMMRVVANAIRTTPKLSDCEPMSFLGALMQCASLGLEPNTVLGHAYMIPFDRSKKVRNAQTGREEWVKIPEVQVVIGYKGLIDLARRSGHITSIAANIHYSDDDLWEYEEGTEAKLRHRPGALAGQKLHAYAIAKFKDGGHAYVVLPWSHVLKIRDGSQGYQTAVRLGKTADAPWVKHEDEMAKKTAIRALSKYLPLSVEFMDALQVDEARADYRAFAMDPTAGVSLDGDEIEGEATEGAPASASQIPQDRAVAQEPAAPKRTRHEIQQDFYKQQKQPAKPAQADPAPQAQTRAQNGDPKSMQSGSTGTLDLQPAAEADDEMVERLERVLAGIIADLEDGSHPDEIAEVWGAQIEMIEQHLPKEAADLRERMAAIRERG